MNKTIKSLRTDERFTYHNTRLVKLSEKSRFEGLKCNAKNPRTGTKYYINPDTIVK